MAQSRTSKRRFSILALFLVGAGLLILGVAAVFLLPKTQSQASSAKDLSAVPYEVNYKAPEVSLNDLQGNPVSLSDSLGKVVLVNHWATWCPPCKAEMPALQDFYEAYQNEGFTTIAINEGEPVG